MVFFLFHEKTPRLILRIRNKGLKKEKLPLDNRAQFVQGDIPLAK